MTKEYKELQDRFNELSEIIKSNKALGSCKNTSHEIYGEQSEVAMKMMKIRSVH